MSEQPPIIPGYEHPSDAKYNKKSVYKTLTTDGKRKNVYVGTASPKSYVTVGVSEQDKCPVCQAIYTTSCSCVFSDKKCDSGHTWYTNRDGDTLVGNPHKSN